MSMWPKGWETLSFFWENLTVIDFLILGLGTSLFLYQIGLFFSICRSASGWTEMSTEEKGLRHRRFQWEFQILSSLIELLPVLGILGTVWGIMGALGYIRTVETPTIGTIAQRLAPALSTTFLGLSFALLNLTVYSFLLPYMEERLYFDETETLLGAEIEVLEQKGSSSVEEMGG